MKLKTTNGKTIEVFEFQHQKDDKIMSAWATHFRNHYCLDSDIDYLRSIFGFSRSQYLKDLKFPDSLKDFGPSVRAGDFGEILIADYLQYILKFWVPRTRYSNKTVRNESTKGVDIIGFKIVNKGVDSFKDELAMFEVKAQFSGKKAKPRLQNAVDDSMKDEIRKGESLNAIRQRLFDKKKFESIVLVDRFQNPEDRPYTELSGAVALFSSNLYDANSVSNTNTAAHPNSNNLYLLVVHGDAMMRLVHDLYDRAANEA